jgi:TatD DNase family protein
MEWQRERFRTHIRAARQACCRWSSTRAAPRTTRWHPARRGRGRQRRVSAGGVFHCFTETAQVARAALDLGFYISFSGILTFKTRRTCATWLPLCRWIAC